MAEAANYLPQVRDQYENYPYPPRDPQAEKTEFYYSHPCALDCMNYYHFGGRRNFRKGFRALVAGGGTGDSTLMLAEQLRGTAADIVHLDISEASLRIAKERAAIRGLDNITWIHGSLLDAPRLVDGRFDYINCSGVLHHLESPEAGLAALTEVLAEDGVMGLMLYAAYGRQGVYQIQELMRLLNKDEPDMQRRVENCKIVLKNLSADSAFRQVQHLYYDMQLGDIGIYDLFLHSQDVAYTIPQVHALLSGAGLVLEHLFFGQYADAGNDLYNPQAYLRGHALNQKIAVLDLPQKQAVAELAHGRIIKHMFYAAGTANPRPSLDNLDNVPFFSMVLPDNFAGTLYRAAMASQPGQEIAIKSFNREVRFIRTPHAAEFFRLMDGKRSLGEIFKALSSSSSALKAEFEKLFLAFNSQDLMFLRHASAAPVRSIEAIRAGR